MNKEHYDLIINALQEHINDCHFYLDPVTDTELLLKLSGAKLLDLMTFCKAESEKMTRILMVDLYHIIGMGNMSPIQEAKFLKLVKEYSKFRSDVKAIAKGLADLNNLPQLPVATKFKLIELCDLTLTSEVRCGSEAASETVEDNCSVVDYTLTKHKVDFPFELSSNDGIKVLEKDLSLFITKCEAWGLHDIDVKTVDNLISVIKGQRQAFGFKWSCVRDGERLLSIVAKPKTDTTRTFVERIKNSLQTN